MRVRLTIDVELELRRRIEEAAAMGNISVGEFIERALKHEIDAKPADNRASDHA